MEKKDHEFCLRCGRKLKDPQMRKLGYGMICYKKLAFDGKEPLFRAKVKDVIAEESIADRAKSDTLTL